jgi:hypothetical protein
LALRRWNHLGKEGKSDEAIPEQFAALGRVPRLPAEGHRGPLRAFVAEFVDPVLRGLGFNYRKQLLWNRRVGTIRHCVEVQQSKYARGNAGAFTINLGVLSAEVYEAVHGRQPPIVVSPAEGQIQLRLEAVMPGGPHAENAEPGDQSDYWWFIDAGTDRISLGRDIGQALARWGVPFLDGFDSLERVRDFYRYLLEARPGRATTVEFAALLAKTGDELGATRMLNELVSSAFTEWRRPHTHKPVRRAAADRIATIVRIAERLGLPVQTPEGFMIR